VADLPEIIPIFPLPNFVLFPGLSVPLHIFEPRYREMVADASQNHGIVGMTMLKGDWERDYYANPDIYEVGCAGRISSLARLPDGRFNLMLDGFSEFRLTHEIRERSYRLGRVEWTPSRPERLELDPAAVETLRDLLVRFLGEVGGSVWQNVIEDRGLRGANLINFLCFHIDIPGIEKQTLLEAGEARANTLIDVLTFKLEERKLGPGNPSGGRSGPLQ
jgi:Lon protease-like protein